MDHAREIFEEAVRKAGEFRRDVKLWGVYTLDKSVSHAKVTVQSQGGEEFRLDFTVGANDKVTASASGLNGWPIPECTLTSDSIEDAITDAIQWKLGSTGLFNSD
jgi:hypothetical protein